MHYILRAPKPILEKLLQPTTENFPKKQQFYKIFNKNKVNVMNRNIRI